MSVLRLKLPTDPRWVNIVEKNIEEILSDHAWCEQKAATNAITIVTNNPTFKLVPSARQIVSSLQIFVQASNEN
jgi:tRNA isopentenyl-2-thiomethyl-A-37 hydroxylase MiaE